MYGMRRGIIGYSKTEIIGKWFGDVTLSKVEHVRRIKLSASHKKQLI